MIAQPDAPSPEPTGRTRRPWAWVPSLYFAEGIPYVIVMTVSVTLYKRLGVSNTEIALYTSWLYLPWVIKPLWSPVVDLLKTRRAWIVAMQLLIGAGLAGVALTLPGDDFLRWSLAFLWLLAFSSATHDIAADGFYMLGLDRPQQAWFVGVRSTFYRLAMITGQGLLVMLAGVLETRTGNVPLAWSLTFYLLAALFVGFSAWHQFVLPRPVADRRGSNATLAGLFTGFAETFVSFFRKPGIIAILAFLLLFRFAEAQLVKMASPFLLDVAADGGLGLGTAQVGFVYGTVGVLMLTIGGLLGGFLAARHGLKFWLWWMVAAINLPNAVYIFLAWVQPEAFWIVNVAVAVEQFGYGFGFTAYMLFMIQVAEGKHETAHFAICTGFMALGMMLPGMFSGWLQELLGYRNFFLWVMAATLPSFLVAALIPLKPGFGRKERA
jgi:PAT family beta-lactamase induction signal transducer AmpG